MHARCRRALSRSSACKPRPPAAAICTGRWRRRRARSTGPAMRTPRSASRQESTEAPPALAGPMTVAAATRSPYRRSMLSPSSVHGMDPSNHVACNCTASVGKVPNWELHWPGAHCRLLLPPSRMLQTNGLAACHQSINQAINRAPAAPRFHALPRAAGPGVEESGIAASHRSVNHAAAISNAPSRLPPAPDRPPLNRRRPPLSRPPKAAPVR